MPDTRCCSLDDVSKWCDVMQNLCQFSVLLTSLFVKCFKIVNWNA